MKIEELGADALWHCYQRGYSNLMRSGVYFRQILRPGLSHTYFQRALPLLHEYAAANREELDLPPGFRERLDACPLSPRDLLHLDYAICLGYVEIEGLDPQALLTKPVMQWPGPGAVSGVFIAADALLASGVEMFGEEEDTDFEDDGSEAQDEPDGGDSTPPFDL
jgi:hypothetical protein